MLITREQAKQVIVAMTKFATSEKTNDQAVVFYDQVAVDTLYTQWCSEYIDSLLSPKPDPLDLNVLYTFDQHPHYVDYGIFNNMFVKVEINLADGHNYVWIKLQMIKDEDLKTPIYDIDDEQMIFLSEYTLTDYDDIVEVLRSKLNITI